MNQLLSSDLWPTISRLAKTSLKRAAISYVSSDKHLKFGDGDLLICDASDEAIKSAHTDAKILKRAFDRGAEIHSCPGLHAKVMLLNDKAIVGSANASLSSASNLIEASLLTDSPVTVAKVQSFILEVKSRSAVVTEETIARLMKIDVIRAGRTPLGPKRPRISIRASRTWIIGIHDLLRERPDDRKQVDKTRRRLKAELVRRRSSVEDICWFGSSRFRKECKPGDWLILMYTPEGRKTPSQVYRRLPLIDREELNGATYFYYEFFKNSDQTAISWQQFKGLLKKTGISRLVKPGSEFEISDHHASALDILWNQK